MPSQRAVVGAFAWCVLSTFPTTLVQAQSSFIERIRQKYDRAIQQADEPAPGVPGFGPQPDEQPVLGFGVDAEVRAFVTEEDRRRAREPLRAYDLNRDGYIDRAEARNGRGHDNDLFVWDKNHDGRLSRSELALRSAKRRFRDGSAGGPALRPSTNNPSDREREERERREREQRMRTEAERRRAQYEAMRGSWSLAERLMRQYDANHDGRLDSMERRAMGINSGTADANRDGEIRRDELAGWLAAEEAKVSTRGPVELPEWFSECDRDHDGQVSMAEFADEWTDEKLDEFASLDTNSDGMIVPDEGLAAVLRRNPKHSNHTMQVLPSKGTIRSRIEVEETKHILDLDVRLSITHTHDEHLNAYLIGPEGESVELFTGVGGQDDNFNDTILDDEAPAQIVRARPPFAGTFQPEAVTKGQPGLKRFYGQSMAGTWTLLIEAHSDRPGALLSWSLLFKAADDEPQENPLIRRDEPARDESAR